MKLEVRFDNERVTVSLAILFRAAPENFRCFFRNQEHETQGRRK